ncbi:uncharacterized protein LOC131638150 [Vicia villosa]|uniref:uncharacterized protein LOC131638150 n=1 Tax=Vicia villosa TaxID=3911 RepID=UPI00273CDC8F|nr:uncharacterized protein LOC131638150 [Vicia villosa]
MSTPVPIGEDKSSSEFVVGQANGESVVGDVVEVNGVNPSGSESDESGDEEYPDDYCWERVVKDGQSAQKNVLHFPRCVTKHYLFWNQRSIELIDEDTRKNYYVEIGCKRKRKKLLKKEKFMGQGWYQFAKNRNLGTGDILFFTITSPPRRLYVTLRNP